MGIGLNLKYPMLLSTKECLFAKGLLQMYNLAKWIRMTDKSLQSSSDFVSVTAKHFVTSDRINKLRSNI